MSPFEKFEKCHFEFPLLKRKPHGKASLNVDPKRKEKLFCPENFGFMKIENRDENCHNNCNYNFSPL